MTVKQDELERIVKRILDSFPEDQRWPKNIIEEVFVIIEKDMVYRIPYNVMIKTDNKYKDEVNQTNGKLVKAFTGLETLREGVPATRTGLITHYSELG